MVAGPASSGYDLAASYCGPWCRRSEAIALALANPGSLLILDDSLGRRIAHLNNVTYTGTLGVLVKAKKEGLLPSVSPVVEALRKTTMYLTQALIEKLLKEAGEA